MLDALNRNNPDNARKPISVLIVDDQELIRCGFKAVFDAYPDIEVVGIAKDGDEAIQKALQLHPDVVLMDIRMPVLNGIEATRAISSNPNLKDTHVLVLTTFDLDEYVYDALKAGASGFLLKDCEPERIAEAIRVINGGDALIEPSVTKRLISAFVRAENPNAHAHDEKCQDMLSTLTNREIEILRLAAKGLSNNDIADELFISPSTVKTHIARIMAKTDSHDRAQLVVFAYRSNLV